MVLMKIFDTISSYILAIASQKLVSRIVLPCKSIHNNRDIFYDEMALIFFMNTVAKPHVKRLTVPLIAERQAGKLWIPIFIVFL